jgi:GxxExxY protein
MDTGEDRVNLLSKRIIGCALTVLCVLGTGFLEEVYESALVHEFRKSGLGVSQQHPMLVRYDGIVVGEYTVDLLVEHIALVELKVAKAIDEFSARSESHRLAYLPATQLRQASP